MLRRTVFVLAVVLAGAVAVPAWANHTVPEGKDCDDFTYQEEAQEYFDAHPGDPEGLDGVPGPTSSGVPNKACETLPPRPGTTVVPTTTVATLVTTTTLAGQATTTTVRPAAPTRAAVALTG